MVVNLNEVLGCSKGDRKEVEIGRWVRSWGKGSWNEKKRVIEGRDSVTRRLAGKMTSEG